MFYLGFRVEVPEVRLHGADMLRAVVQSYAPVTTNHRCFVSALKALRALNPNPSCDHEALIPAVLKVARRFLNLQQQDYVLIIPWAYAAMKMVTSSSGEASLVWC